MKRFFTVMLLAVGLCVAGFSALYVWYGRPIFLEEYTQEVKRLAREVARQDFQEQMRVRALQEGGAIRVGSVTMRTCVPMDGERTAVFHSTFEQVMGLRVCDIVSDKGGKTRTDTCRLLPLQKGTSPIANASRLKTYELWDVRKQESHGYLRNICPGGEVVTTLRSSVPSRPIHAEKHGVRIEGCVSDNTSGEVFVSNAGDVGVSVVRRSAQSRGEINTEITLRPQERWFLADARPTDVIYVYDLGLKTVVMSDVRLACTKKR